MSPHQRAVTLGHPDLAVLVVSPKAQHPPIVPVWPRPSSDCLSQATVSRLFIFKIPVVFLPEPEERCQPQRACGLGLGPEAPGGASGHPAAAGQFWEGFEASWPAELLRKPWNAQTAGLRHWPLSLVGAQGPTRVTARLYIKSSDTLCYKMSHCLPHIQSNRRDTASTERRKGGPCPPCGEDSHEAYTLCWGVEGPTEEVVARDSD